MYNMVGCVGTVFVFRNIRIVIHSNDHEPPHIHAVSPKGKAKIELTTLECYYCRGYTSKDLKMILKFVTEHKETLMEAWNEI
jgi:hypothetical protein